MKQAVIINGPKGIFDLRFFFLLIKNGITKIDTLDKKFNPNRHTK